jgi:hypothetical protein
MSKVIAIHEATERADLWVSSLAVAMSKSHPRVNAHWLPQLPKKI